MSVEPFRRRERISWNISPQLWQGMPLLPVAYGPHVCLFPFFTSRTSSSQVLEPISNVLWVRKCCT
eukprot:8849185-Karenia_brevis.AAC.1